MTRLGLALFRRRMIAFAVVVLHVDAALPRGRTGRSSASATGSTGATGGSVVIRNALPTSGALSALSTLHALSILPTVDASSILKSVDDALSTARPTADASGSTLSAALVVVGSSGVEIGESASYRRRRHRRHFLLNRLVGFDERRLSEIALLVDVAGDVGIRRFGTPVSGAVNEPRRFRRWRRGFTPRAVGVAIPDRIGRRRKIILPFTILVEITGTEGGLLD